MRPVNYTSVEGSFYLYMEDVDEAFKTAVAAGAKVRMPVQEMFWGDRAGTVEDPFGYAWFLATHTRDLTMEEIRREQRQCSRKRPLNDPHRVTPVREWSASYPRLPWGQACDNPASVV